MAGYSLGFGDHISGFFTAGDFFTITIRNLLSVYFFGLGLPFIVISIRNFRESAPESAKNIDLDDECGSDRLGKILEIFYINPSLFIDIFAIYNLIILILCLYFKVPPWYQLTFIFVFFAFSSRWWKIAVQLSLSNFITELLWCMLVFSISVFGLSLDQGFLDRHAPYKSLSYNRVSCDKFTVLTPIGSRFIAVTSDDKRHLIDDKCQVVFEFSPSYIASSEPLFATMYRIYKY
ncbi:hypothetical protein [Novosphingobium sp.]|uniref:hypothetical protein n=1 Tax=Novosphingobium sp. TaxID=1874826 RepID=UPI0026276A38|nr:hypothetical protein [Novosphingobium sp.]